MPSNGLASPLTFTWHTIGVLLCLSNRIGFLPSCLVANTQLSPPIACQYFFAIHFAVLPFCYGGGVLPILSV
ncbi:hypothetical protein KBT16_07675, partial [Nostoc sp. CCCryo 231-06]|nr:hypothetical protein [Nostoc sp. CCCryo 231-06]